MAEHLRVEKDHNHGNRVVHKGRIIGYFEKIASPDPKDEHYVCFEAVYHMGSAGKGAYISNSVYADSERKAKDIIADHAFAPIR